MATRRPGRRRKGPTRPPRVHAPSELRALLRAIKEESAEFLAEMPFSAYLQKVEKDPTLARLSHQRIHDMILAAGVSTGPDGRPRYRLFANEVFGADDVIRQIVDYFAAAARRLDVRRRILLLVGPPGSGKSTLVNAIKRGLEEYTRRPEGAVYAIKGCPVHEEPLHLIPPHRRGELGSVYIEGDLCPYCRWLSRQVLQGDVARVPVERVTFSVGEGIGIGTFVATDPGSEDLTRLVGRVDTTLLHGTDLEAARRAFRLDGELNAANRGLADLIEIFKMDERFLSVLLTLAQEQFIKISGPMTMYADEAIVAHSNLAEYEALIQDPKAAALQDRLVVVKVHYVLSVQDEVRIYQKLLGETDLRDLHVCPLALPAAATVAVLTRLARPQRGGWDLRKKLHAYDGRFVPDAWPEDLQALRKEAPDEGLSGISPRWVINQLSQAVSREEGCLTGGRLLDTLWEGLAQRAGFKEEDRERWTELFDIARAEYNDMVRRTVRRATVGGFHSTAAARAEDAVKDLELWSRGVDEYELQSLRSLERSLGVPQYRRQEFRQSLLAQVQAARERGVKELHRADPRLEEAVERMLLPTWADVARTLIRQEEEGKAAEKERDELRRRLVQQEGFDRPCAEELLKHATRLAIQGRERGEVPRGFRLFGR